MSDSHSHGHAHGHEHAHDVSKHNRIYIAVFIALILGTMLTVFMYSVHFDSMAVTITVALFIATVKALLVAGFFMHLISEKKAIYSTLAVTFFFFAAMMYLIVWSKDQVPRGTEYFSTKRVPHPMASTPK
jgi:cytochrome c oxidase subunit 4